MTHWHKPLSWQHHWTPRINAHVLAHSTCHFEQCGWSHGYILPQGSLNSNIDIPLIATQLLSGETLNDAIERVDSMYGEFNPSRSSLPSSQQNQASPHEEIAIQSLFEHQLSQLWGRAKKQTKTSILNHTIISYCSLLGWFVCSRLDWVWWRIVQGKIVQGHQEHCQAVQSYSGGNHCNEWSKLYKAARNGDKWYGRTNCLRENCTRPPKRTCIGTRLAARDHMMIRHLNLLVQMVQEEKQPQVARDLCKRTPRKHCQAEILKFASFIYIQSKGSTRVGSKVRNNASDQTQTSRCLFGENKYYWLSPDNANFG